MKISNVVEMVCKKAPERVRKKQQKLKWRDEKVRMTEN